MSRYSRNSGNYAYPDAPPRWDAERFARERDYRQTDEYYQPAPPPRRQRPVYEEDRYYYEDDRYGPRGQVYDRRYFEEDEYYDPRAQRGQMIPFRPPPRPEAPPRPGLIRRQSSLDTFDRPPRRYDDYNPYRPPPRIDVDVPEPPPPRENRYRPSRPSRAGPDYESAYYDEVAIQDPDYYGDDGFREYREREWVRQRRRDSSGSHSRTRPSTEAPVEEVREEKKEVKKEVKEKPYPRKGKTKMPKRLVHTKVLFDLGYPFYEEGDKTIIIEKALGPDNIDEVFSKSREYFARETSTTRLIEAPPAPATSVRSPPGGRGVREEVREEIIFKETDVTTKPLSEAPRSVREWDQLTARDDRSTRSRRKSEIIRERSPMDRETIIEKKSTVVERSPSPTRRRRKSRRRSRSFDETEIVERKIITEQDEFPIESDSVHIGPLAMVVNRDKRTDRDIKREIRELENEQRKLRRERRGERISSDFITIERRESRSRSRHRSRSRSRSRSPSPIAIERIVGRRSPPRARSRSRSRVKSQVVEEIVLDTSPPRRARSRSRVRSPVREEIILDTSPLRRARSRSRARSSIRNEIILDERSPERGALVINRRSPARDQVIVDRRSSPNRGEIIIERRDGDDEILEVRKDRRDRSFSRARQPSAGLIRGMLYTAT